MINISTSHKMCNKELLKVFVFVDDSTDTYYPSKKPSPLIQSRCPMLKQTCCTHIQLNSLSLQVLEIREKLYYILERVNELFTYFNDNIGWIEGLTFTVPSDNKKLCFTNEAKKLLGLHFNILKNNKRDIKNNMIDSLKWFMNFYASFGCSMCSLELSDNVNRSESNENEIELLYNYRNVIALIKNFDLLLENFFIHAPFFSLFSLINCKLFGERGESTFKTQDEFFFLLKEKKRCAELVQNKKAFLNDEKCMRVLNTVGPYNKTGIIDILNTAVGMPLEIIHKIEAKKNKDRYQKMIMPNYHAKDVTQEPFKQDTIFHFKKLRKFSFNKVTVDFVDVKGIRFDENLMNMTNSVKRIFVRLFVIVTLLMF